MSKTEILRSPVDSLTNADRLVFDFADPQQTALWLPMNDAVMGGVSAGSLTQYTATTALFHGVVSLEHGGGFSSVRTPLAEYNLSAFEELTVVIRGDGKRYKLNMTANGSPSAALYQSGFGTVPDQWVAVKIPFSDFVPTFRGRQLTDHPPLDTIRIRSFGLMISEKQAGEFTLEIALIAAGR